jgi:valyl-tRNA synthetase
LKLLHPFAPFITEKLWHLLKFKGDLIVQDYPKPIKDVPQNVNVNILTEVISAFRNLRTKVGLKPHESCDILISGNEDFLNLVKNYEDLLKSILKADNIYYREDGADIEDDWTVGVVYNIKLGLK